MKVKHVPVMLEEVLEYLIKTSSPERIVDATLGLGGYSEAILNRIEEAKVFGIDRDPQALTMASERLSSFGERFIPIKGNFSDLKGLLEDINGTPVGGVVFDLGVSNMQISLPERGFSFRENGPLDMRMNHEDGGESAADMVRELTAPELSEIFRKYGEERFAWPIAKSIVRHREKSGPIEDTDTLVEVIRKALPAPVMRKAKGHPARKVFQALRIAVNKEMDALNDGLDAALKVISPGGVVVVVSYHSLEDRVVKWKFREWKDQGEGVILTKKALTPSDLEIENNPKSRSAKLRAFAKG
ncbi:16S rRNA (cytosine(1402)-N(4))-methyltransferase RsmH [Dethiosulfovibrio sp. F2B]|uniref:16S rRNA (cytosine(1402)-N(4))-methyltransferase RsmH n=1 Tax=Dethiosulfovibrio faecalis TaxID=2720018 RepID=UPI001F47AECB|nr:16S rRNA (cytosine(1402)-N(4))-methyltransferase RsmH [Dethiosulfovibrio faecalis]